MLAAEFSTLPAMQDAVERFFDDNETWLTAVLEDGRRPSRCTTPARRDVARMIVGALEGGCSWPACTGSRTLLGRQRLLASLAATAHPGSAEPRQVDSARERA